MGKKLPPTEETGAMNTRARLGSSRCAVSQKAVVGAEKKMAATVKKANKKAKVLPKEEEVEEVSVESEEEEEKLYEVPESGLSGFAASEPPVQSVAELQLSASGAKVGESQVTCVPVSTPQGTSESTIAMEGESLVASADWSPWSGMCISQGAEGSGALLGEMESTSGCNNTQAAAAMDSNPQLREKAGTSCTAVMEAGHVLGKEDAILEAETSCTAKGKLRPPSETYRESSKEREEGKIPAKNPAKIQGTPPQMAPTDAASAEGGMEASMEWDYLAETVALQVLEEKPAGAPEPCSSCKPCGYSAPCEEDWIWYRGKCYYFSETYDEWNNSQNFCASHNASLSLIDSQEELDFLIRHKDIADHWIGLYRDAEGIMWVWANGSKFKNTFRIEGRSPCVYLSDNHLVSTSCHRDKKWICNKLEPNVHRNVFRRRQ